MPFAQEIFFRSPQHACILFQTFPPSTATLLGPVDPITKACLTCDILHAWQAVDNGVTGQTSKNWLKYWIQWKNYTRNFGRNAYLMDTNKIEQQIIITTFAAWIRIGYYSRGAQ
eukprot:2593288-Ditylum_brightwellii.AAC.1